MIIMKQNPVEKARCLPETMQKRSNPLVVVLEIRIKHTLRTNAVNTPDTPRDQRVLNSTKASNALRK